MSHADVVELELNIKEAKDIVALGDALERLEKNRDFKKVIKEAYLHEEAIRLVHLKADANMQNERIQQNVLRDIDSIGAFAQFLQEVFRRADMARDAVIACEETLDDIRGEGDDE